MKRARLLAAVISAGLVILNAGMVGGQDFPTKPVRILTSAVGGGSDFVARVVAQELSGSLGQPVIVDNRSGVIPAEIVARALPNGYTLLVYGATFWLTPLLQTVSYDVDKDFTAITLAIRSPNVLVVHPAVAANSVSDLIALAKAKPGELNYSSGPIGAPTHLATELLKSMAGINIVRIPYQGTGPAIQALIGREVQLTITSPASVMPLVKAGRLKALASTSAAPSPLLPGLPTISAVLPGYESESIIGMFAPGKTPGAIVKQLNQETVRTLRRPDVKEKIFSTGSEAVGSSPEGFTAMVKAEMSRMGKVIKDAGIRAE